MSQLNLMAKTIARRSYANEVFEEVSRWADIPAAHMWVAVVRSCAGFMNQFLEAANSISPSRAHALALRGYVFRKGAAPGQIRLYTVSTLGRGEQISNECRRLASVWDYNICSRLMETREEALKDERTAIPWVKSPSITKKHIRKSTNMSIQVFLMQKLGYNESNAKSYADQITAELWPLEVKYAETPEDFTHMYSTGPGSCMTPTKSENSVLYSFGLCGPSWYAYHPYTKGAYIEDASKQVLARTILFQQEDGTWKHGRIYGVRDKLVRSLNTVGITELKSLYDRKCEFRIPAVGKEGHHYCPAPYLDNISGDIIKYTYDDEANEFIFAINQPSNKTRGWKQYSSSTVPHRSSEDCQASYRCGCCGNTSSAPPLRIPGNSTRYCSRECIETASAGQYTAGMTRSGTLAVAATSETRRTVEGTVYVNQLAITERACPYYRYGPYCHAEEGSEEYSDTATPTRKVNSSGTPFFTEKVQRNVTYSPSYRPSEGIVWPKPDNPFGDYAALKTFNLHPSISGMAKALKPTAIVWDDSPESVAA